MKKIRAICAVLVLVLALGGCSGKADGGLIKAPTVNLSAGKEWKVESNAESLKAFASAEERLTQMTLVASEGGTELYFDTSTCDIAYKGNGGLFFSTPWDLSLDTKSVDTQKQKIASQLRLSFMDSKQSVSEIFSFNECVSKGQYTLERLENGVQVNMIIGRAEQRTLLPTALTVESYERVREALQKRGQARLKAFYKLYDVETSPQNQIDVIKEKYPVVEEIPIYVLKNVTDKEKNELEGYFAEAGYTFEDMEKDLETVGAVEEETISPRFVISIRYELNSKGELEVIIPTDKIEYDQKHFTLLEIGALEYFAAASADKEGYLFVPDGSGAVIGFNSSGEKLGNDIKLPVYGYDRAVTYNSGYENLMTASLPVYGISSQNGTLLAMIDEGAAMADIVASSGGNISGYAKAGAVLTYCDYDSFDYKDVNTQYSWTLADKNRYEGIYKISYALLNSGDGYSEMAKYYRERIKLSKKSAEDLKLVLGLLGSVKHTDEFLFIPIERQIALTSFENAQAIAEEMLKEGVNSLDLRYIGWSNGGIEGRAYTSASVEGVLGGKKELKALNKGLKEKNVGLYLDADTVFVSKNSLFDGFTATSDTSRMLDNTYAGFTKVRLSSGLMNDESFMYALTPKAMLSMFNKFNSGYKKLGISGLSLSSMGISLNSDKDDKGGANRSTAELYTEKLLESAAEDYSVMVEGANGYCFNFAQTVINAPAAASGYPDADYSVPFLQMVIHGALDYTTAAVNLSGDYRTEILKAIENGSGIYFELAYQNAELLKTGEYTAYYTVDYKIWEDKIIDCYNQVSLAIGDLTQETIINHKYIADGVSRVEYSNNTVIYVNYNSADVAADGVTVPAGSYLRVEKGA